MVNIEKYGEFKPIGKTKRKKQIVLCHTSREVGEYLTSLKFRYNGKYDKIPHFVITKEGKVLQLLPEASYSNFLSDEVWNKNAVVVCLENLGWLEKKPLTYDYINWNGSIYSEKVYEKKWRDFFFWDPYTSSQIESTAVLSSHLMESLQIEKRCIGHNVKIDGGLLFEGIISRSNFDTKYTDLNPSFDFETFTKFIENEQFA